MSRMIPWAIKHSDGREESVLAATPEAAAKKVVGTMYGCHWERFRKVEDVPEWGIRVCVVTSHEQGAFHCVLVEHG